MNALLAALLLPSAPPVAPPPRPVERLIADAAGGIHVLTDRAESVPAFLRRHRAMAGAIMLGSPSDDPERKLGRSLDDVLAASEPVTEVLVSYPTWNAGSKAGYGALVTVVPPSAAAAKLLRDGRAAAEKRGGGRLDVILREDDAVPGRWHVAGYTTRTFLFHKNEALQFTPAGQ